MRRALHMLLAVIGVPVFIAWCALLALMVGLAVLGHRLWPEADRGNCFTFALPRWFAEGGSLLIVPSSLWIGPLPVLHAIWVPQDNGPGLVQTEPVARVSTSAPWWRKALAPWYFRYTVEAGPDKRQRWRWRERRR